jgi:hypothetical protein
MTDAHEIHGVTHKHGGDAPHSHLDGDKSHAHGGSTAGGSSYSEPFIEDEE